MTLTEFEAVLSNAKQADVTNGALLALRQDLKGNWDAAHKIAQSIGDTNGAWVHAYLHRKNGDISNAKYWYSRAGRKLSDIAFDDELKLIVEQVLASGDRISNPTG